MPELQFRIYGLNQDQLDPRDPEDQRPNRKSRRRPNVSPAVASFMATVVILTGLEVYLSRFSGVAVASDANMHHEMGRLRETGGRRTPSQAIWGRRITGGPNCDCNGVDFGILTGEFRKDCLQKEKNLKELYAAGTLGLVGENGKLVAGEFCSSNSGARAWPVAGGPVRKPPGIPEGTLCNPSGLSRNCQ